LQARISAEPEGAQALKMAKGKKTKQPATSKKSDQKKKAQQIEGKFLLVDSWNRQQQWVQIPWPRNITTFVAEGLVPLTFNSLAPTFYNPSLNFVL